jgi:hypothetical protein
MTPPATTSLIPLSRITLFAVAASIGFIGACSREVPAGAGKSPAVTAHAPETTATASARNSSTSIAGDTLVLVAIGSQSTRVPVSDSAPCGFLPYLRLVISDEKAFYHVEDNKPTCFGPPTDSASHWSGEWSTYRVNRDTLHLFKGDGDETFYWVSGILSADSLIQVSSDKPLRFTRIRPTATTTRR